MSSDIKKNTGMFSMLASYLLVLVLGVFFGPKTTSILQELLWFFTGQISKVPQGDLEFLDMLSVLMLVIAIKIPLLIAAVIFARTIVGKKGKSAISEMLEQMRGKHLFLLLFGIVLIEELLFRGVFLGVVPKIESLSGTLAFYVIALISTALFALAHLGNFGKTVEQKFVRVLPQFVGGLFLVYVFYKFGLLAAVICHFASNAILFSTHKLQNTNWVDGLLAGLHGVYVLVAWVMLSKPLSDVLIWFENTPEFALPGWGFWDYFWVAILLTSAAKLILDLLLYDKNYIGDAEKIPIPKNADDWFAFALTALGFIIGATVLVTVLYHLLNLVITNVPMAVLISSVVLCLPLRSPSASATQRIFWSVVPATYVAICLNEAMGIIGSAMLMVVVGLVHIPVVITARWDD